MSKVRYAAPFAGSTAMRASWSLRTDPLETFCGAEKEAPPSVETATKIGEWLPLPLNCAQVT
ncbi:MAG: hypothetical protein ACXWLM_11280 [Myxococcales bacterium]